MWNLQRNFKVISKFFSCQVRILQRARACNWEVSWAITHQNLRREWLKHLWHLTSNSIRETNTSKKAAECPSGRWIARGHHWLHGLYSPWNSPGQNTGVGSLFLLKGIFTTHGSNPGLPHCGQILYQLSHKERPYSSVLFSKQRIVHPRGVRVGWPQRRGLNLS